MKEKTTYAAFGLIDWIAIIPIGKSRMEVKFTGGAITKYGATPAEFSTSDPFTKRMIEQSEYFKNGKIKKMRSSIIKTPNEATTNAGHANTPHADSKNEEIALTIEDAILMLSSRFSVPSARIRTPEAAISIAARHGIALKIISR